MKRDERSERIGLRIRPQLKEKLQLLARMRNTSISRQVEVIIESQIEAELLKAKEEILKVIEEV